MPSEEPTAEQRAEWDAWVAERLPAVRAIAEKFPPWVCLRGTNGRENGHYLVLAYEEPKDDGPITLKIAHGADSFMPGFSVFGVPAEDLTPCGCGEWAWPSEEQAHESCATVDAFKADVEAAGLKILPGLKLVPNDAE